MSLGPLVWFAIGRMVFSLIERWSSKFFWVELVAISLYLLFGFCLLRVPNPAIQGLLIAGIFLSTALSSRLLVHRHPIEASNSGEMRPGKELVIGIIDFVWLSIMAATLAIICFAQSSHPFNDITLRGQFSSEYWKAELSNTVFLLNKTIDSVFLLGGILGGCMAILWAGEIWRKRDLRNSQKYIFTTVAAMRMVVAYFVVIATALYWIGVPLYERMNNLPYY